MQPLPRYRIYTTPRTYAAILLQAAGRRRLQGTACRDLEAAIEKLGVSHAICTATARLAIFLAVRAFITPGQKVVLSPYTISDVINMVICAGGRPVFADIERETCNIDPAEIERLVDAETGAVMVTHLHGLACPMDRIVSICRERNVPLIEDAAQAFGVRYDNRPVGTFGKAGIYSFGMYKNVNAFFGGMLVTSEGDVGARVREEVRQFPYHEAGAYLRKALHGLTTDLATYPPLFRSLTYRLFRYGFLHDVGMLNRRVTIDIDPRIKRALPESYRRRMTPLQARIILRQLPWVDEHIRARIRAATVYHEGLRDLSDVILPPLRSDFSHTYTYFSIQVPDREAFLRHLMRERRDVAAQHLKNCADLPCFEEFHRDCPRARATARSVALLPTYPRYDLSEVEQNIRVIRRYFGKS